MHCFDNVVVIVCIIKCFILVYCENDYDKDESDSDKDDLTPEDLYSFVALIDVVFTEGSKKSCTGTIIHDYVVITAAHCFKIEDDNIIHAELTGSFVVIGTKKMFDTGYEQYLPIERFIIHPNYSGWTADLALVYTFAGMMSDKPGRIVPLASEKTSSPVDPDVTVFSWGQFKISNMVPTSAAKIETCSDEDTYKALDGRIGRVGKQKSTSYIPSKPNSVEDMVQFSPTTHKIETSKTSPKQNKRQRQPRKKRKNRKKIRNMKPNIDKQEKYHIRHSSSETRSKYRHELLRYENITMFDSEAEQLSWERKKVIKIINNLQIELETSYGFTPGPSSSLKRVEENLERFYKIKHTTGMYFKQAFRATSYYRNNWRRKMGDQQNKLTVEIFGFVNMQMCKKLVEKAMPSLYELKNLNEVLCYSSEAHFITEEDSGAPAMRRGRLVAVTVGGVDFEGERVAVGMKMTCFCSWILENIPQGGINWKCCKNCCENKDDTVPNHLLFRHAYGSKDRSKT